MRSAPSLSRRSQWMMTLILMLVALLLFVVYEPGLHGDFLFDDDTSIIRNDWVHIEDLSVESLTVAALSFDGGPLKRPVAMFSFALNYYLSGLDPYAFKLTNLVIHLVTGVVLFALTRLLLLGWRRRLVHEWSDTRVAWSAAAVASVWLLHPLALTTVLYVVQRMAGLSALFVFSALTLYLWGRLRMVAGRRGGGGAIGAALLICFPLALFSKENALLFPLYLLLVEWLVLDFDVADEHWRRRLRRVAWWLVAGGAAAVILYIALRPGVVTGSYVLRDFSLGERLLTEARAGWWYLRMIIAPSLTELGLFHDDFGLSRGLFQPLLTAPAVAGWMGLVAAALVFHRRAPVFAFGVLFFVSGHLLESTVFGLELVHEHRNYLPMFGPLLVLGYWVLGSNSERFSLRVRALLVVGVVVSFAAVTHMRALAWNNPADQWYAELAHHPDSPTVNYEFARFHFFLLRELPADSPQREGVYRLARSYFERSQEIARYYPAGLFGLILLEAEMGREPRPEDVERLMGRLAREPLSSFSVNLLHQLSQCHVAGECRLSDRLVARLLGTALDNPKGSSRSRAMLLSDAAVIALREKRWAVALEYSREAAELHPEEGQHQMNYIQLLLMAGRLEEADRRLQALRRAPPLRMVPRRLELLERQRAGLGEEAGGGGTTP